MFAHPAESDHLTHMNHTRPDSPEGTEVMIEPMRNGGAKIGIDESERSDDSASLADMRASSEAESTTLCGHPLVVPGSR